jgi:phage host-nuclease inhibitor protein Gam
MIHRLATRVLTPVVVAVAQHFDSELKAHAAHIHELYLEIERLRSRLSEWEVTQANLLAEKGDTQTP